MERYLSYSTFLKKKFGKKVYKICLNGGFTCPNRDGSLSKQGCFFCSEGGSGEFCESPSLSIAEQIDRGKGQTGRKYHGESYIAYFQAFTNTYAPLKKLEQLYTQAIVPDEIVGLSIGTRPDCLPEDVLHLLSCLNQRKPVFLELGLQTCHDGTARNMNRGYDTVIFEKAVEKCALMGIRVTAHIILGLPGEDEEKISETIQYLNRLPIGGVKLSMLHVLKNTPLADMYRDQPFPVFTLEEYVHCVLRCIEELRPDIVIERITGDGPKDLLITPLWSRDKRRVLNTIHQEMKRQDIWQGQRYPNPLLQ